MIDLRCHSNEIWDKMGDNSALLKENCTLFAPTPLFSGQRYLMVSFKFSPNNPRCHGNEIWYKIGHNSAYVRDSCKIFAYIGGFRGKAIE